MGQQNPETCSYIGTVSTPYHEWNIYLVGSLNPAKIKHIIWMSWVWQWETPWVGETTACPNLQGISFNDKKTFSFKKQHAIKHGWKITRPSSMIFPFRCQVWSKQVNKSFWDKAKKHVVGLIFMYLIMSPSYHRWIPWISLELQYCILDR